MLIYYLKLHSNKKITEIGKFQHKSIMVKQFI